MAVLSKQEARTERAKKHARRRYVCAICAAVSRGNGGISSHIRKHLRDAGLTSGDWSYLLDHPELRVAPTRPAPKRSSAQARADHAFNSSGKCYCDDNHHHGARRGECSCCTGYPKSESNPTLKRTARTAPKGRKRS